MGRLYGNNPQPSKGASGGRLYKKNPQLFEYHPIEPTPQPKPQVQQRQPVPVPSTRSSEFLSMPFWKQIFQPEVRQEILPSIAKAAKKTADTVKSLATPEGFLKVGRLFGSGNVETGQNLAMPYANRLYQQSVQQQNQQVSNLLDRYQKETNPRKKQKIGEILKQYRGQTPQRTDFSQSFAKTTAQIYGDTAMAGLEFATSLLPGSIAGKAAESTAPILTRPLGQVLKEGAARLATREGAAALAKTVAPEAGLGALFGGIGAVQSGSTSPLKIAKESAKMAVLAPVLAGALKLGARGVSEIAVNLSDIIDKPLRELKPADLTRITRSVEKISKETPKVEAVIPKEVKTEAALPDTAKLPEFTKATEPGPEHAVAVEPKPLREKTIGEPTGQAKELKLYSGSRGTVSTEYKSFDRVKTFKNDQHDVIASLARDGNNKAQELIANPKDFYVKADRIIKDHYGNKFDAIKYENKQLPQKGIEYHDLSGGKFYSVNKDLASIYARQNRDLKYENPSKIAKSIEQKAIEKGLTKGFKDLAGYDTITIKEQAARAAEVMKDLENAKKIIRGEEPLPEGLKGTALITAAEEHIKKTGDANMAYELANSPLVSGTSQAAQELRLAAEREPDSAAAKILELKKAREAAAEKRFGDLKGAKATVKKQLKAQLRAAAPKVEDWASFVDSIRCT